MKIFQSVVGPFQCNCRLLVCPITKSAALIDPGDEPDKIIKMMERASSELGSEVKLELILHTHAHLDHFGATREIKEKFTSSKICLHQEDLPLYKQLKMQGAMFGIDYQDPKEVDQFLRDEEEFQVGKIKLKALHTPGHSPGSLSFRLFQDSDIKSEESVFSGDTLFKESVGRTDLWGANQDAMFSSIKNRLLTLDDDTKVCPGHGPDSTIAHEKRKNPFLS